MARQKSSCFKKLLMGCGCFTGLFILFGAGVAVLVKVNRPLPAEYDDVSLEQVLGNLEDTGLNIPGEDPKQAKPICLRIDVGKTGLTLVPDSADSTVRVSGSYDKANFELITEVNEGADCTEYAIRLKDKNMFFANNDGRMNQLVLHLPRNQPIDLDLELSMGSLDMDLTGVPIKSLVLDTSMSNQEIRMATANPMTIEKFDIQSSMGSSRIEDIQNFRFQNGFIKTTMGEMKIFNSGPLEFDTSLSLDMTMGEIFFQAPEATRVKSSFDCTMGEYQGPRQVKADEQSPLLTLKGDCSMGAIRVVTGKHKPLFTTVMYQTWQTSGVEAAIDQYQHELKGNTENYSFGPHKLRTFGYKLLDSGHPEDALKVFELNAEEYPDYHKTYRALAAAERKLGNLEKALEHLEEALAIDPDYRSAIKMKREISEELGISREGESN